MLGEKIVAKYLRDQGKLVEESLDVFDSEKDMIVDGNNVEVKTQAPLFYYDSFGVNLNQVKKLENSYRVYWLSVPLSTKDDQYSGCLFEMDPKVAKMELIKFKGGRQVAGYRRNGPGMKIVYKIEEESLLNQLKELSSSYM